MGLSGTLFGLSSFVAVLSVGVTAQTPSTVSDDVSIKLANYPVARPYRVAREVRYAEERLAQAPDSPETVRALRAAGLPDRALDVVERIVETRPELIADAFEALQLQAYTLTDSRLEPQRARAVALATRVRQQWDRLTREHQFRAAMQLMWYSEMTELPSSVYTNTGAALIREYRDTPAIAAMEQAQRLASVTDGDALAQFVDKEFAGDGSSLPPWAEATKRLGALVRRQVQREPLPIDNLLEGLSIVQELRQSAPESWLPLTERIFLDSVFPGYQVTRLQARRHADVLFQLVSRRPAMWNDPRIGARFRTFVTMRLPAVIRASGGTEAEVAEAFDRLAATSPEPDELRLQQAYRELSVAYAGLGERSRTSKRKLQQETAAGRRRLASIVSRRADQLGLRARLALAEHQLQVGRLDEAREHFKTLADYGRALPGTWVAALRVAQIDQVLGNLDLASRGFADISLTYANEAAIVMVAALYEARAHEAQQRFDAAAQAYTKSLAHWNEAERSLDGLDWPLANLSQDDRWLQWPSRFDRREVYRRVTELQHSQARHTPDLERARWLLAAYRPADADQLLDELQRSRPSLLQEPDVLELVHRARYEAGRSGLWKGPVERARATDALAGLCREPFDNWVGLACAATASLDVVRGDASSASTKLLATLARWHTFSSSAGPAPANDSLEAAALAVRDSLFQPESASSNMTGPILVKAAFLLLPATLDVESTVPATSTTIDAGRPPHGLSNVVFLPGTIARRLTQDATSIAGCDDERVLRHQRNMWMATMGLPLYHCTLATQNYSLPLIERVRFLDRALTRAVVNIEGDRAGKEVELGSTFGEWGVIRLIRSWEE